MNKFSHVQQLVPLAKWFGLVRTDLQVEKEKRGLALPVLKRFSSMLHLSSFLTTDRIENGYDDHLC